MLGGGNTAMDCCRTARRLGGEDVKVVVRSGFEEMKASPWEKEDAMHEGIPILNYLVPKEFTHDGGRLTGVAVREGRGARSTTRAGASSLPTGEPDVTIECDDVLVAIGQENAFPWIERDIGLEFDRWGMPKVDPDDHAVDASRRSSSAATRPSGRRTSSGPSPTATRRRSRSTASASGENVAERPPPHGEPRLSQKMGIHEWTYDNEISLDQRYKVPLRDQAVALKDIKVEVELGFDRAARLRRDAALPQLRRRRRCSRATCASSATPASTSARRTASPSR